MVNSGLDAWRKKRREERKAIEAEKSAQTEDPVGNTDRRTAGLIPWQPGQSGNPSGRPQLPPELRARLRDLAPKAIERLGEMLDDADPRIRGMASQAILDRLYGKPTQAVDAEVRTTNVQQAHLQILLELQAKRDDAMKLIEGDTQKASVHDPENINE